jgi:hypothetical protein
MSHRSFMARVAVTAGYSHEAAEDIVQKALDEHAHELAEQQRATGRDDRCAGTDCCQPHGGVADLIDPQTDDHWAPESGTS